MARGVIMAAKNNGRSRLLLSTGWLAFSVLRTYAAQGRVPRPPTYPLGQYILIVSQCCPRGGALAAHAFPADREGTAASTGLKRVLQCSIHRADFGLGKT